MRIFAPAFETNVSGVIAQLVEQRTENPCVPGSIPGGTTEKKRRKSVSSFFVTQNETTPLRHFASFFCSFLQIYLILALAEWSA